MLGTRVAPSFLICNNTAVPPLFPQYSVYNNELLDRIKLNNHYQNLYLLPLIRAVLLLPCNRLELQYNARAVYAEDYQVVEGFKRIDDRNL